jgi:Flp pilus assembly pilin Flp
VISAGKAVDGGVVFEGLSFSRHNHQVSRGKPGGGSCRALKENRMLAIRRFLKDESGTETLEWGLVAGLIVIGAITAIAIVGPKVKTYWTATSTAVQAAPAP